eukprot:901834-Amphidinium_carterae.1
MSAESKAAKEQGICFDWLKGNCKRGDQCNLRANINTRSPRYLLHLHLRRDRDRKPCASSI